MKLLITGAFGNLGQMCIEEALACGMSVRCFDRDTASNRRTAARFGDSIDVRWGDIRRTDAYDSLLEDVAAVIHNASILPPATETHPRLAKEVNVTACSAFIKAAARRKNRPVFIFPSSVTVYGLPDSSRRIKTAKCNTVATDVYTEHKLKIERLLEEQCLPYVILRIGVSVDSRTLSADRSTIRKLLNVTPSNPLEYVHPRDVALAMCRAAVTRDAWNRTLLIGGGPECRITQRQFLLAPFTALGLRLPESVHGDDAFYTHWMDASESQEILQSQRHSFDDYQKEIAHRFRHLRLALFPVRLLVNALLDKAVRQI